MTAWEPTPAAPPQQAAQAGQQPAPPAAPARRRDEGLRAKKLPCGHILHLRCLKSWLERQQVCPTCRRPVVVPTATTTTGRPGAPGAVQNGAQARQPAQRQGRARILNLGPIRIGFLNGPGDQINNLVRQMQNLNQPNAQAPPAAQAAQDPNQQGPNHLGLQVPYANNTQQPTDQIANWQNVPTQTQFRLMEQRIMQEVQTLGVEQQQLYYLRLLEAELARLRQWHAYRPENQVHGRPSGPQPGAPIVQSVQHYPPAQTLHGSPGEQFGNGHESLPEGMVLPEGWTVMPLRRSGLEALIQGASTQQVPAHGGQPGAASNATPTAGGEQAHTNAQQSTAPTAPGDGTSSDSQAQTQAGPTDDRGSPLFVPREPQPQSSTTTTAAEAANPSSAPPPTLQQDATPPRIEPSSEAKAPWNSEGWSFVEPPNGNAALSESAAATQQSATYEGKGKAKAAEVEDAPDEGT